MPVLLCESPHSPWGDGEYRFIYSSPVLWGCGLLKSQPYGEGTLGLRVLFFFYQLTNAFKKMMFYLLSRTLNCFQHVTTILPEMEVLCYFFFFVADENFNLSHTLFLSALHPLDFVQHRGFQFSLALFLFCSFYIQCFPALTMKIFNAESEKCTMITFPFLFFQLIINFP